MNYPSPETVRVIVRQLVADQESALFNSPREVVAHYSHMMQAMQVTLSETIEDARTGWVLDHELQPKRTVLYNEMREYRP